jgi:hypothetical protein
MWPFNNRALLVAAIGLLAIAPHASAQNSSVKIYESAFNKFAALIQPLQFTQRYALRFTIRTFWGSRETITLCDSTVVANILNVRFDIAPSGITITGIGVGSWCGLGILAPEVRLSATAFYSASSRTVRINVGNVAVAPRVIVPIPGWAQLLGLPSRIDVALPRFSVGASFAVPPIPVDSGLLHVEAPAGPIQVPVRARNVQLIRRNGYLELTSNVQVR